MRQASAARAIQGLAAQRARAAQDGERRARALEDEKANLVTESVKALTFAAQISAVPSLAVPLWLHQFGPCQIWLYQWS